MPDSFAEHEENGVVYMTAPVITARHAFSTRYGGVSSGDFASLNLGFNRGDDTANVLENYRRLGAAVGIDALHGAYTNQVHGTVVRLVGEGDRRHLDAGKGPECDGLVTVTPGLPIFCFTADCVPVLLHDPVRGATGAVHCGWRSSVGDIIGETIRLMCSLGCRAENICAAIGPAIGCAAFETDNDVPDALRAWLGRDAEEYIFTGRKAGKFNVDLRGALAHRMLSLGLKREHIAVSGECTFEKHEKYWSHRYTSKHGALRGSQCAVIELA